MTMSPAPRRMLTPSEAALYCGVPKARFKAIVAVPAVAMPHGRRLFDLRDLDRWLDGLAQKSLNDDDAIIARLGT